MADAEDVVQNAFVRVFKADVPEAAQVLTYLYQATRWCALDQVRSLGRRRDRETFSVAAVETQTWFVSELVLTEREQEIQGAMQRLPEDQREVLVMKIWGELTFQQIGDVQGLSLNTVASRYRYALQALREKLQPEMMYEQG